MISRAVCKCNRDLETVNRGAQIYSRNVIRVFAPTAENCSRNHGAQSYKRTTVVASYIHIRYT